jgi:hypothetical protein
MTNRRRIFRGIYTPGQLEVLRLIREGKVARHSNRNDPYHLPIYRHPLARQRARATRKENG